MHLIDGICSKHHPKAPTSTTLIAATFFKLTKQPPTERTRPTGHYPSCSPCQSLSSLRLLCIFDWYHQQHFRVRRLPLGQSFVFVSLFDWRTESCHWFRHGSITTIGLLILHLSILTDTNTLWIFRNFAALCYERHTWGLSEWTTWAVKQPQHFPSTIRFTCGSYLETHPPDATVSCVSWQAIQIITEALFSHSHDHLITRSIRFHSERSTFHMGKENPINGQSLHSAEVHWVWV